MIVTYNEYNGSAGNGTNGDSSGGNDRICSPHLPYIIWSPDHSSEANLHGHNVLLFHDGSALESFAH